MSTPIYLSAQEAAAELGVRPATLYAYVSRGLIRSVAGPGKQRRYDAADVRRLQGRKEPDNPEQPKPLSGDPVLETELTLIAEGGPYYRGQPARDLARNSTLETVATLLWGCTEDPFAEAPPAPAPKLPDGLTPLDRLVMALAAWPLQDKAAYTLAPRLLHVKGAALLRYGVAALLDTTPSAKPIHTQIAEALKVPSPYRSVLRAALVLAADHELNTSAFAARCAASIRTPLHSALISALGAFAGPRHGAAADRVTAWLGQIEPETDIEAVLATRLRLGETLPGFGHPIYRNGDPRAECLLEILYETSGADPFVARLPQIIAISEELFGVHPNIDFAFAAFQKSLRLPDGSAKMIFCAGRMVGWIAHVLEQYRSQDHIRPRAAYVGARPK